MNNKFSTESEIWVNTLRKFPWEIFVTITFPREILVKHGDKFAGKALKNFEAKLANGRLDVFRMTEFGAKHDNLHAHYLLGTEVVVKDLKDAWAQSLSLNSKLLPTQAFHHSSIKDGTIDTFLIYMNKYIPTPHLKTLLERYALETFHFVRGPKLAALHDHTGNLKEIQHGDLEIYNEMKSRELQLQMAKRDLPTEFRDTVRKAYPYDVPPEDLHLDHYQALLELLQEG